MAKNWYLNQSYFSEHIFKLQLLVTGKETFVDTLSCAPSAAPHLLRPMLRAAEFGLATSDQVKVRHLS